MSKKDFKAGMVAGAKPFEVKIREVQNANIAALQKLASETSNEVGELIGIAEEHELLLNYKWKQECKLESFAEKSILIGFLLFAIDEISNEEPSDPQRHFLNSMYKYFKLNISSLFSKKIDISYLSNNNDVAFQKLLYLLVCVYFYLENENFEFIESNPEVFDYFNVSPKDRKDIQDLIAERAGYFDFNLLFAPNEEEISEDIPQEEEDNTVGCNLPENLEEVAYDELFLVKAGEETVVHDKKVYIKANFQVNGKLTFQNCRILIDTNDGSSQLNVDKSGAASLSKKTDCQINVTSTGTLVFDNCEFLNQKQIEKYFIQLNDGYESHGKLIFKHCSILDCWMLAGFKGCSHDDYEIEISKSIIKFSNDFKPTHRSEDKALFDTCKLSLIDSEVEGALSEDTFLYSLKASKCKFTNCSELFSGHDQEISDSNFYSCEKLGTPSLIANCFFYKCKNIFEISFSSEKMIIKESKFEECENQIIDIDCFGSVSVESCEFRNIKQTVSYVNMFSANPIEAELKIENCVFDNVSLSENGAIARNPDSLSKVKSWSGSISGCTFNNITRKESEKNESGVISRLIFNRKQPVIKQKSYYKGMFGKEHDYTAYYITDCIGLDGLL